MGEIGMPRMLEAARGRCTAAHFGTYDYTASCSITAAYQDMLHPACDFARSMMQVSFGGTGVWLSDGATNIMPIAPHRGEDLTAEQIAENRTSSTVPGNCITITAAIRWHNAFYQGWDLHPGTAADTLRRRLHLLSRRPRSGVRTVKKLCRERPRRRHWSAMCLTTPRPGRACSIIFCGRSIAGP